MNVEKLSEVCKDAVEFLKQNGDPHCAIIITQTEIRLVRDEIGIPTKEKTAE